MEAIQHVPNMVDGEVGRTEEFGLNVVVLSDGGDTCSAADGRLDPCGAAAQVKKALPYSWFHVVSVADDLAAVACIAEETDGMKIESTDTETLKGILKYVASARK